MTVTEEITLPGFRSDLHAFGYQFGNLSPAPAELGLSNFGFELLYPDPNFSQVFPDGRLVSMYRDLDETVASISRYSPRDGETWRNMFRDYLDTKEEIAAWMNAPPPTWPRPPTGWPQPRRPGEIPLRSPEHAVLVRRAV